MPETTLQNRRGRSSAVIRSKPKGRASSRSRSPLSRNVSKSILRDHVLKRQDIPTFHRSSNGERWLEVTMQPEKHVRARYVSEGNRAPIRGLTEGVQTYPTVQIHGYEGPAVVDVFLANAGGQSAHQNILVRSTNTSDACDEVILPVAVDAIRVRVDESKAMRAVFDNLSIRRLRKVELEKRALDRGEAPPSEQRDNPNRSKACLKFIARIPKATGGEEILTTTSRPLECAALQESSEIHLVSPAQGSVEGGYLLTLVGKRFKTGFKVRFTTVDPHETWEEVVTGNKDFSNQGAAVITVPKYFNTSISAPTDVYVSVRTGTESNPLYSEPATFTYMPHVGVVCDRCNPIFLPALPSPEKLEPQPISPYSDKSSPALPSQPRDMYLLDVLTPVQTPSPPSPEPQFTPLSVQPSEPISNAWSLEDLVAFPFLFDESDLSSVSSADFSQSITPTPPVQSFPAMTNVSSTLHNSSGLDLLPGSLTSAVSTDMSKPILPRPTNVSEEGDWTAIEGVVSRLEEIMSENLITSFAHLVVLKDHRDAYLLKLYQRCRHDCLAASLPVEQAVVLMEKKLLKILPILQKGSMQPRNFQTTLVQ